MILLKPVFRNNLLQFKNIQHKLLTVNILSKSMRFKLDFNNFGVQNQI